MSPQSGTKTFIDPRVHEGLCKNLRIPRSRTTPRVEGQASLLPRIRAVCLRGFVRRTPITKAI